MRKTALDPKELAEGAEAIKGVVDTVKGMFPKRQEPVEKSDVSVLQQDTILDRQLRTLSEFGISEENHNSLLQRFQPSMAASNAEVFKIIDAISDFLTLSKQVMPNVQSDYANDFIQFVLKYFKSVSDVQSVMEQIQKLSQKLAEGQDLYVLGAIGDSPESKSLMTLSILMNAYGKYDDKTFSELSQVAKLSTMMYGERSEELKSSHLLRDSVAKTNFSALSKSRAKFRLMVPVYITANAATQLMYQTLTGIYGSEFANAVVNNPLVKMYFVVKINAGKALSSLKDPSNADLISGGVK